MFIIDDEVFVEIKEFEGYAIGNNGTVLSCKNSKQQWKKLTPYHGSTSDYLCIQLRKNNKSYHCLIHRLVALHFVEGYFENAVVGHIDANIHNNNYKNLKWMTQKENIHQSYVDSGISATRNYKKYIIFYEDKPVSPTIVGTPNVTKYIKEHYLNCSPTSLIRHRKSRKFTLKIVE